MVRTASPVREAHLSPPRLPSPKHRPIVENGTFSTGPFVRNRREPRPGRPSEAPPTQAICQRGVRGPARRMETLPAPGSLWFLSPAGKELARPQTCETPSSRIFLLPVCLLFPHLTLRQYRTNELAAPAMPFLPSAACRFFDLPPVNLQNLPLNLTKNSFASAPTHLCGIALNGADSVPRARSAPFPAAPSLP